MKDLIEKALGSKVWVVVGANTNTSKFGNKIYRRLKTAGYVTYPMNPAYEKVDGDICYSSPADLPQIPGCANIVVAPAKGRTLLQPLYDRGIRLLWFQPGAYDQQIIDEAVAKGFEVIFDYCVLIELNNGGM